MKNYEVTFNPPRDVKRFTLLWINGSSEVIGGKESENFHEAFERNGFGRLAIATLSKYVEGSRMNDFRYDRQTYSWVEIANDNAMHRILDTVQSLPYPAGL